MYRKRALPLVLLVASCLLAAQLPLPQQNVDTAAVERHPILGQPAIIQMHQRHDRQQQRARRQALEVAAGGDGALQRSNPVGALGCR